MLTMDDSSQASILQRWKREQEEQRQYQLLRRRRYLQMERQHQRQRMVMAAMEQHERRRKRYQRALEQRHQQSRRAAHHQPLYEDDDPSATAMRDIAEVDVKKDEQDTVADNNNVNKLATLETIKHQLAFYVQHCLEFLDQQLQYSDTTRHQSTTATRWTLFKRLVSLLMYEDILMRLLLRLDGVTSDGDDGIRQQRKALVNRINGFLDELDQYKQRCVGGGM